MKTYFSIFINGLHIVSILCFVILFIGCNSNYENDSIDTSLHIDSVAILIKESKNRNIEIEKRKGSLLKAYHISNFESNDSIRNLQLRAIAFEAFKLKDSAFFIKTNSLAFELSKQLQDTFGMADAHWNLGEYYLRNEDLSDSYFHYNQAHNNFEILKNYYYSGRMLFNMAIVQNNARDYTGSEISTFQAIGKFDKKIHFKNLYRCYNNLGIVYNKLEEYDKALFYHNLAIEYLNKVVDRGTLEEGSQNNIGLVYQEQKNFKKAAIHFYRALKNDSLKYDNIGLYARLLDNITYNRFKIGETNSLETDFLRAFSIRDSMNNVSGMVLSKLHMAEFYLSKSDSIKAMVLTKDAARLAETVDNHRDRLVALKLLSEIDKANSHTYLNNYIALNDSLQLQDLAIRNKFTRIRYETDEYVEETERLASQNVLISIIGLTSLLLISLLYFIKRQSSKNKELILEKQQQDANEEIYKLMLERHAKLEEGRLEERHRISEDLHDGVLGKLFGTRVGLGFLNIEGDTETLEKHQFYIDEMQHIEKEIRDISHEMKNEILSSEADFSVIIGDYIKPKSEMHLFNYIINNNNDIPWSTINDNIKISLYRIIQEAIQNILKHANATTITINFDLGQEGLLLSIVDDGSGFDERTIKKGIGLKNMKSRVAKFNGTIVLNSHADKGTTLTVIIPYKL